MFAITQSCNNVTELVGFVHQTNDFLTSVDNYVKKLYGSDYLNLDNISTDQLYSDSKYQENTYLIKYDQEIILVKKHIQINQGYIYNTKTYRIDQLYSWFLMPIDIKIDSNISLITNLIKPQINPESFEKSSDKFDYGIDYFNVDKMRKNPVILVIGKRCSGKTALINQLIKRMNFTDMNQGLIVSRNDKTGQFYSECYPNANVEYSLNNNSFSKFLEKQTNIINDESITDKSGYVIIEDCLSRTKETTESSVWEALMNGRNYHLTTIVSMQVPKLPQDIGLNVDYIFIMNQDSAINRELCWKKFCGVFPSYDAFHQSFIKCTDSDKYKCMVIDNMSSSDKVSDKVYWFQTIKKIEI